MSLISSRFLSTERGRAAPARANMSKITPITGNTSVANETIRFQLPNSRVGTYADPERSMLSFTVEVDKECKMSPLGALGFFKNIVVRNASNYLSTIDRNNIYRNMLHRCAPENVLYSQTDGHILHGMLDVTTGARIGPGPTEKKTFVIFMTDLCGLFQTGSMIPLFTSDFLEIDMLLSAVSDNLTFVDMSSNEVTSLKFSDIVLNLATVEIPADVDSSIIKEQNGLFKYPCQNVGHFQSSVIANTSSHTFNLGMSYSSLNRLLIVMVPNKAPNEDQISIFSKNNVVRATLFNDGNPQQISGGIESKHDAINLAFARISNHALTDTSFIQSASEGGSAYADNSFMIAFDLESLSGKSESLRSSLDVTNTNTQLVLDFGVGGSTEDVTLHVFPLYDTLISLDLSSPSRNFEISI
jgi:hypothetical protein